MKIISLKTNPAQYSSNTFLILGAWNKMGDVNALVDTGVDDYIIRDIKEINTGAGKIPINKVILTHTHFDHIGAVKELKKEFGAEIMAFTPFAGVDRLLKDREVLLLGSSYFEVIHTPGHSSDSICLYCKQHGVLFSGDTSIEISGSDATYTNDYIESIKKLSQLKISIVYPGHGKPIVDNPEKLVKNSMELMEKTNPSRYAFSKKTIIG